MTGRDRIVAIVVGVVVVLGAGWMLVVSPERQQASKLGTQVSEAQSQLSSAEGKLASARVAQAQYATAYASVVSLGKAVPPSAEVPSLIYQLSQASSREERPLRLDRRQRLVVVERDGRGRGDADGVHADAVHVRVRRRLL